MTSTKVLNLTVFDYVYTLFGAADDRTLISRMCVGFLAYTIVSAVATWWKAAPYGKHSEGSSSWYGPLINAKVAWMIQESPAWILPVVLIFGGNRVYFGNPANAVLILLFVAHYVNRSLIYPLRLSSNARPVPLLISVSAWLFCTYNGFLQGHSLLNVYLVDGLSPFFYFGVTLFLVGMTINIYHDEVLISLRTSSTTGFNSGDKGKYKIPRGALFDYVSGANYTGEILEWWGYAVASGGQAQFLFAIFSTLFLGVRAWQTHQFYCKTFGQSYPVKRKAVIPFIL